MVVAFAFASRQPFRSPQPQEVRLRLNYLERVLRMGAGPNTELGKLTAQNPEWGLFTLAFTGYALQNLAQQDSSWREEAAHYTELAIEQALSLPIRGAFEHGEFSTQATDTTGSVLYLGHLNLLLGCHRQLRPASAYIPLHNGISRALARRYAQDPSGCLESYTGMRWVPDNTVAIASLALHSRLTGSSYQQVVQRWVARARRQYVLAPTQLLASRVDSLGKPEEAPRGSMVGWSIWFLTQTDSTFARQQYEHYRDAHSTNLGLMQPFREQAGRWETSIGDVDSGPLLLGYGIPATTFALADAVAMRDWRTARRIQRIIGLGSREVTGNSETRYGVRLVELDVSPLAESLLLWAETAQP
ncbi:hypothetical protein GCM10027346_07900 [Hymenobacter seoulensis]